MQGPVRGELCNERSAIASDGEGKRFRSTRVRSQNCRIMAVYGIISSTD